VGVQIDTRQTIAALSEVATPIAGKCRLKPKLTQAT
jgi:hypothetical protein